MVSKFSNNKIPTEPVGPGILIGTYKAEVKLARTVQGFDALAVMTTSLHGVSVSMPRWHVYGLPRWK